MVHRGSKTLRVGLAALLSVSLIALEASPAFAAGGWGRHNQGEQQPDSQPQANQPQNDQSARDAERAARDAERQQQMEQQRQQRDAQRQQQDNEGRRQRDAERQQQMEQQRQQRDAQRQQQDNEGRRQRDAERQQQMEQQRQQRDAQRQQQDNEGRRQRDAERQQQMEQQRQQRDAQRQQQDNEGRRQRDAERQQPPYQSAQDNRSNGRDTRGDNRGDNRPAQLAGNDSRQNRGGYDGRGDHRAQQPEFYRHDIRREERSDRRDYRQDRHHHDWSDRRWLPPQVVYRNIYYYVPAPQTTIYVAPRDYYGYNDYDTYYRSTYGYRRPVCNSDAVGAFIGGILGGVIGANSSSHHGRGAVGGVIIGALIGGVLGRAIDDNNQACVGEVLEYVPTDETVDWTDPDTGGYYEVTPLRTYQRDEETYCREYQTYIEIDGRSQRAYGTACRQPDGAWKQVSYQG